MEAIVSQNPVHQFAEKINGLTLIGTSVAKGFRLFFHKQFFFCYQKTIKKQTVCAWNVFQAPIQSEKVPQSLLKN